MLRETSLYVYKIQWENFTSPLEIKITKRLFSGSKCNSPSQARPPESWMAGTELDILGISTSIFLSVLFTKTARHFIIAI